MTHTEERSVHTNLQICFFSTQVVTNSIKFKIDHSDIKTFNHRIQFDSFVYS